MAGGGRAVRALLIILFLLLLVLSNVLRAGDRAAPSLRFTRVPAAGGGTVLGLYPLRGRAGVRLRSYRGCVQRAL